MKQRIVNQQFAIHVVDPDTKERVIKTFARGLQTFTDEEAKHWYVLANTSSPDALQAAEAKAAAEREAAFRAAVADAVTKEVARLRGGDEAAFEKRVADAVDAQLAADQPARDAAFAKAVAAEVEARAKAAQDQAADGAKKDTAKDAGKK